MDDNTVSIQYPQSSKWQQREPKIKECDDDY